jgi:xylulokinase
MDYAVASRTLAFDIHRLEWSQPILDAAGLSPDLFPPPVAPGEPVGEIGPEASAAFGLPEGCVVAGGIHDQPAGILGASVMPGESMLAMGTTICLGVRLKGKPTGETMVENNLCYYPTVGDRQYISIAYNFTGGSLLKWYRDHLAGEELTEAKQRGVDPYEIITSGLPEGPTGLFVLPHFTTTGTPWLDPKALGAVLGLRLTSSRKEIVKAILEGILYEIRLNGELLRASGVEVELYKVIGGATKSETWMQIAADILGRPVAITSVGEGAALGAALMGALASGTVPSLDAMYELVSKSAKVERLLEPQAEHTAKYSERFEIYKDLYPKTKELSHRIFDLTST